MSVHCCTFRFLRSFVVFTHLTIWLKPYCISLTHYFYTIIAVHIVLFPVKSAWICSFCFLLQSRATESFWRQNSWICFRFAVFSPDLLIVYGGVSHETEREWRIFMQDEAVYWKDMHEICQNHHAHLKKIPCCFSKHPLLFSETSLAHFFKHPFLRFQLLKLWLLGLLFILDSFVFRTRFSNLII